MTLPPRPSLAADDNLAEAPDMDINAALAELIAQRERSPIIRPSRAAEVTALVDSGFPADGGDSLEKLVAQITDATESYPRRNTHPGFFGWIAPSGLPSDPLAHAMVAALNENVGGHWSSPIGTAIERTVIRWLADLADFPAQSEGVLMSGGSLANLSGIASALFKRFGPEYRNRGLTAPGGDSPPVVICSHEAHFSIRRAVVLLGLGADNIVAVDTDAEFRMRVDLLEAALEQNRNVVCVVASAGTTNTGAIDPLDEIAELCARHDTWLHVDAAYGGGGLMSGELRPRYRGIERADSLVMDLHKWFYQSLDGSLLLYRDAESARRLFSDGSNYLGFKEDSSLGQFRFLDLSPELSRRFRALPFYIAMRCYGFDRLGRNALHNTRCAEYLAALVRHHEDLDLIVAPQLSILCFRFDPRGFGEDEVDRINSSIRDQVQLEGDYLMSASRIHGRPVLRVSIINHATRAEHIEGLIDSVLRIGRSLLRDRTSPGSQRVDS